MTRVSANLGERMRVLYFQAVLRQEVAGGGLAGPRCPG